MFRKGTRGRRSGGSFRRKSKYTRRSTAKRTSRKRNVNNPANYTAFPKNKVVRMRYVDNFPVTAGATSASFVIRAGSINDPQFAVGGHSALGALQWAVFYKQYCVTSARIKCEISGIGSTDGPLMCGIYLSPDSSTGTTDLLTLKEQGKCNMKMLNGFTSINTLNLYNSYNAKKFHGVQDLRDNFDKLGAFFGNNPNEDAYFHLLFESPSGDNIVTGIQCVFTVDYTVILSQPKELASDA